MKIDEDDKDDKGRLFIYVVVEKYFDFFLLFLCFFLVFYNS